MIASKALATVPPDKRAATAVAAADESHRPAGFWEEDDQNDAIVPVANL